MMHFKNKIDFSNFYQLYALRLTIVATLSSFLAYSTASAFPELISPIVAGIIALTAIKPTLHDTVKETVRQVVGTLLGAIIGLIMISWIGFNGATLIVLVAISLIAGQLLRLDVQGSLTVAATVLLIAGPLLGDFYNVEQRVAGVVLGSIFAFISGILLTRRNPEKQLLKELIKLGNKNIELLSDISSAFKSDSLNIVKATKWEDKSNRIIEKINIMRDDIQSIYEDSRWSPLIKKEQVKNVRNQTSLTKANAANVRSIIYSVINSLGHNVTLPSKTRVAIGGLLDESIKGMRQQLLIAETNPSGLVTPEVAKKIRDKRRKLASEIRKLEDTREIMLAGIVIHESTNIKDNISEAWS
jgi:uncharacterized membrane protein YgaE (UPF0421/DUF939 family)